MTRRGVIALVVVALVGCGRPRDVKSTVVEAVTLAQDGELEAAVALLTEAARQAQVAEHHDQYLFQAGLLYAQEQMMDEALALWDPVYETTEEETISGRIAFEKGMLYRAVGELDRAEHWFTVMIVDHPDHGLTDTALMRLQKLVRDRAGDEAERDLMEKLLPGALQSSFGDDMLWALHVWYHEHGDDHTAKQYLLAIRKSYPFPTGGRCVDALFALAQMAEKERSWQEAEKYLREIIGPIGTSVLIGSSSGGSKARALFELARIYEQEHEDLPAALEFVEEVIKMKDLTTIVDDAHLEAARLLHEMGKDSRACKHIQKLFDDHPYSNKKKKARKLAAEAGCEIDEKAADE